MQTANENDDEKDNDEARRHSSRTKSPDFHRIYSVVSCKAELVINRAITK